MRRDYHDARPSVTMTGTGDDRSLSHGPRYPGPGPASCSGLGPAAAPASATRAVTREGHADSDGDPPPAAPPGQRPGRRAEGGGPRTVTGLERLRIGPAARDSDRGGTVGATTADQLQVIF